MNNAAIDIEAVEEREREAFLRALEEEAAVNRGNRAGLDVYLDHLLEKLRERQERIKENDAIADRRVAMIEGWRNQVNGSLRQQSKWIELQIQAVADQYDYAGKKSRSLPNGSFGYRSTQDKLVVLNEADAITFAETHGLPVKKSVLLDPLKKYFKSTGEIPEGMDLVPGEDVFFVKAGS